MEKCIKCKKESDIKVDNYHYCAFHYVEAEGEGCLEYDLEYIAEGKILGKNKESTKRIVKEIKKRCPSLISLRKEKE